MENFLFFGTPQFKKRGFTTFMSVCMSVCLYATLKRRLINRFVQDSQQTYQLSHGNTRRILKQSGK